MATLTESSVYARKFIRYSLYGFLIFMFLRFVVLTSVDMYHKYFPEKPEAVITFGKLPKIPFPEREAPTDLTYSLELPSGNLPVLPDLTTVYFMPPFQRSITALDDARRKAAAFKFSPQEKQVAETIPNVYVFQNANEPSNFTINIVTGIFSISYNLDANAQIFARPPSTKETALAKTSSLLGDAGVMPPDTPEDKAKSSFLKVDNGQFVEVSSLSEANFTKISRFRKNYGKKEDIPPVTPNFPEANIWFMFAGGTQNTVFGEYHYFPIDTTRTGLYPIKSADTAWQELNSGKGLIANPGTTDNKKIVIRNVYLAYYDAGQYTPVYQPVVVFEGDNSFAAIVPAIADEYYGAESK